MGLKMFKVRYRNEKITLDNNLSKLLSRKLNIP